MKKLFKKILCPIDFDEKSIEGLDEARNMTEEPDTTIYLLHVVPFIATAEASVAVDYGMMERDAKAKLQDLARKHLEGKVRYEILTRTGDPAHTILNEIEGIGVDSVVMATHGRTGVKRFFLGSVAERVVRESPCPVLTVRPANPRRRVTVRRKNVRNGN
jgi:nucleotide-binding universal stress UspA family protein